MDDLRPLIEQELTHFKIVLEPAVSRPLLYLKACQILVISQEQPPTVRRLVDDPILP